MSAIASTVVPTAVPAGEMSGIVAGTKDDSELLVLAEKHGEVRKAVEAALDEQSELERRRSGPNVPRPKALRIRKSDAKLGIPKHAWNRKEFYEREIDVDALRRDKWFTGEFEPIRTEDYVGSIERRLTPSPEARARADEIVAAFDAWIAKRQKPTPKQIRDVAAAERKVAMLMRRARELENRIASIPANSIAGLVAKARVIEAAFYGRPITTSDDSINCDVTVSLLNDLLKMGKLA